MIITLQCTKSENSDSARNILIICILILHDQLDKEIIRIVYNLKLHHYIHTKHGMANKRQYSVIDVDKFLSYF